MTLSYVKFVIFFVFVLLGITIFLSILTLHFKLTDTNDKNKVGKRKFDLGFKMVTCKGQRANMKVLEPHITKCKEKSNQVGSDIEVDRKKRILMLKICVLEGLGVVNDGKFDETRFDEVISSIYPGTIGDNLMMVTTKCYSNGNSLFQLNPNGIDSYAIRSPRLTDWGNWGTWDDCKSGTFVHGMKIKVEEPQGEDMDNTALNAVQFFCSQLNSKRIEQNITSTQGQWGIWGRAVFCTGNKKAIGFQLRSEPPRRPGYDDTAANDLRLICEGNEVLEGGGTSWGNWSIVRTCPRHQFLCGVRTQIEAYQPNQDDTALNNLDMECCYQHQ